MAAYRLPFGYVHWPQAEARERTAPPVDEPPVERLLVTVPAGLRGRLEASARLEGVPAETWIARALARSVDPRLLGA